MRLTRLAALPLVALLVGCPALPGINGNTDLSPKVLAVTKSGSVGTTANAYLEWQAITNAESYQVLYVLGETSEVADTTSKLSFSEQVQPGLTITYKVRALDGSGNEKASSSPLQVKVMDAQVSAPTDLKVEGETPAKNLFTPTSAKPTISWGKVDNATHYYVKIEKKSDGKVLYASLTDRLEATMGTLVREDLKLPNYPQVKDQTLPTDPVFLSVTAIRADDPDLAKATGIDVKPSAQFTIFRQ